MNLSTVMCTNRPSLPPKGGISRNIVGVAEAAPKISSLIMQSIKHLNFLLILFYFLISAKNHFIYKAIFQYVPFASWFNKP